MAHKVVNVHANDAESAFLIERQLGEAASGRAGIPVQVQVEGQAELPPEVRIAFYRIAQEAVSNVVKHACASRVTIALETQRQAVQLRIEDNGCAEKAKAGMPSGPGLGMNIMRERAESIGGRVDFEQIEDGGTRVLVTWPAGPESAANE
mgnify:CR=1 FL=1